MRNKLDKNLTGNSNWLEEERKRERKMNLFGERDSARYMQMMHEEHCGAEELAQTHRENCDAQKAYDEHASSCDAEVNRLQYPSNRFRNSVSVTGHQKILNHFDEQPGLSKLVIIIVFIIIFLLNLFL